MRLHLMIAALLYGIASTAGMAADPPAEAPTESEVRAVLPLWCAYKNEKRTQLQREADAIFGINPKPPPGRELTMEMLAAHQEAVEKWKEPRLAQLNAAFKAATGLDYYPATHVATKHRLGLECR